MSAKAVGYFALIMGIVFLLVGIAGFVPGLVMEHQPAEGDVVADAGLLFGLFPVNLLHNLVHLAFGIWGVAVFRRFGAARLYAQAVAVIYAVLAVMGFFEGLNTLFGLVPLYGNDIWLHLVIAIAAAIFGFAPIKPEAAAAHRPRT
ncbi:MAG: DUF4383 domain-containing protein [Tistlia sp.]|uniref:DUF4383 domain-containing protein n=1 Tax=Tistlia sp. TaxID=3057121 RepID=UPI0034A4D926